MKVSSGKAKKVLDILEGFKDDYNNIKIEGNKFKVPAHINTYLQNCLFESDKDSERYFVKVPKDPHAEYRYEIINGKHYVTRTYVDPEIKGFRPISNIVFLNEKDLAVFSNPNKVKKEELEQLIVNLWKGMRFGA